MDIITDSQQFSRLDVVDTGRRRRWTDAEKLRIVKESYSRPRYASSTARRYGIASSQLFDWRKACREGRLGEALPNAFVPAVVVPEAAPPGAAKTDGGRMEVVCANGYRIAVGPDFDARALDRLLDLLERRGGRGRLGEVG